MSKVGKFFTFIVLASCVAMTLRYANPPKDKDGEYHIHKFSEIPIVYQGRKKPIHTLAQNTLAFLSNKQSIRHEIDGKQIKISSTEWLLSTISGREEAHDFRIFRIANLDVLSNYGLERRKGFLYSFNEIGGQLTRLDTEANTARSREKMQRDAYDTEILELASRMHLYQKVVESFENQSRYQGEVLLRKVQRLMSFKNVSVPLAVPPLVKDQEWISLSRSTLLMNPVLTEIIPNFTARPDPAGTMLAKIIDAYYEENEENINIFNESLDEYFEYLKDTNPEHLKMLKFEIHFNHLAPFFLCSILYLFVFIISCFGWLRMSRDTLKCAYYLMGWTLLIHTYALIARVFLSGYPPVTNLYSSAIFIGWGCVILALFLERGFKSSPGIGNLVGSTSGFCTLLIAHYLSGDGDTMEMMRAVLDTKFWLWTHVTTVTLGYTATFVSGFIALFYILTRFFPNRMKREEEKSIYKMIYGTTCFAIMLSFIGTVLGGLWADDSWGRFWGWDPKENGALIIVLWNAVMLHARWGNMVKVQGFAVLALVGNIVTAWSWFGVNQLGVGLHSYGFTDSASFWLVVFMCSQLMMIGLGLLPRPARK